MQGYFSICSLSSWARVLCITPPKRYYHLAFFNLPGLQKPGRNHFPKNSYWGITDLGILVSQNNLWANSLIRVQGDCSYISFPSFFLQDLTYQDQGPLISPYEGHRGKDFWGIYFLRFRDSYRTLRIKERTFRTLQTRIRVLRFLLMKDTEDRTFEVYIFWDLGILTGPSGLRKGPSGPFGPRIRVLGFLLMKDPEDRTFEIYIFNLEILSGP